ARRTGGSVDAVTDDEIKAGIRLLAETTGIFTETAGGVTAATLAKLAARGDIGPDERVVLVITGEGLKTLDAVRGTFDSYEIEPSYDAFEAAVGVGV
ncbi:MAG: threonine synthase, partial [Solirubrobacteraceae bacterium]|nr:threonine synthase [Solirubrobacteraceae bacterium]